MTRSQCNLTCRRLATCFLAVTLASASRVAKSMGVVDDGMMLLDTKIYANFRRIRNQAMLVTEDCSSNNAALGYTAFRIGLIHLYTRSQNPYFVTER